MDPSFQLLKNSVKDILDMNQGAGQLFSIKLYAPLKLVSGILASQKENSFTTSSQNGVFVSKKIIVDVLVMFWENYFCKHMVKSICCCKFKCVDQGHAIMREIDKIVLVTIIFEIR